MSRATIDELAQRVDVLERKLAQLLQNETRPARTKDWRRTVGMFAGDEIMEEITALGNQIREADRQDVDP